MFIIGKAKEGRYFPQTVITQIKNLVREIHIKKYNQEEFAEIVNIIFDEGLTQAIDDEHK